MKQATKRHRGGVMRSALAGTAAFLTLTACAGMIAVGAGCDAYGEMRLARPGLDTLPDGAWSDWVTDLDDRMTGVCLGR